MMTAPVASPAVANVAGTWTGTFHSDSNACASSHAHGDVPAERRPGHRHAVRHVLRQLGRLQGHGERQSADGNIEMLGCSGGAVSATISGSGLSLSVGDLTRPIVSGTEVVMYGGAASLQR